MTASHESRLRRIRVRWRLLGLPVRLAIQTAAVTAAGFAIFAILQTTDAVDATAASLLVAVVFGSATVLQHRQAQRRQYTVELIAAFQTTDHLAAADTWMANQIAGDLPVTADVCLADEPRVIAMLDYYEFLAVLAEQGLIDVPLVRNLRGGTMARCFLICHDYIEDRRTRVGPELYRGLEFFTEATRPPAIAGPRHDASSPVAFVRFPGSEGVPNSGTH